MRNTNLLLHTLITNLLSIFCRPNNVTIYAVQKKGTNLPIPKGSIVSFTKIPHIKNNVNMHKITQLRGDLTWQEVVHNFIKF